MTEACGAAAVQGSQVAVNSKGIVYISWVNLGSNFPLGPRSIQIASFNQGNLTAPVTVDPAVEPGESILPAGRLPRFPGHVYGS